MTPYSAASDTATTERQLPLIVELDGTLIASSSRAESLLMHFKAKPWSALRALISGAQTPVDHLDAARLPYHNDLCDFLRAEHARDRRIFLSAADRRVAEVVAAHLGVFEGVIAFDRNLHSAPMQEVVAINQAVGPEFAYAGSSRHTSVPVWDSSAAQIVVGDPRSVPDCIAARGKIERSFTGQPSRGLALVRAMRPHQWLKNLLVFVPLLTSFSFSQTSAVLACLQAFVALSLCASSTYIINDLFDLESDRAHPRKRLRPFASGELPIGDGVLASVALMAGGLMVGALVNTTLLAVLLVYVGTTIAYSLHLKGFILLDVIVLAGLYAIRIIAGGVAIGVQISVWLFAFAFFLFVSLALIKRCAELVMFEQQGVQSQRGRDYSVADLRVLWPLGIGMGVSSIVVFAFYLNSPDVAGRYASPQVLWAVPLALVYWLGRMWIKTSRGEMTDDPLIFAIRNRGSRIAIVAMLVATLAAYFVGPL